jgi:hypothetical protein
VLRGLDAATTVGLGITAGGSSEDMLVAEDCEKAKIHDMEINTVASPMQP